MNKIIYLISVLLSALSAKAVTTTHATPSLTEYSKKTSSNVYSLRTPEYLKKESN
jgi:hypothetical protein